MKKGLFGFYGSLRSGMYNHKYFEKYVTNKLGQVVLDGYKLFNLGSYPCAIRTDSPSDKLVVEIMELTDIGANSVHSMEIGAGYHTETVNVDGQEFVIYLYPQSSLSRLKEREVPGGDWVKFLQMDNEKQTV